MKAGESWRSVIRKGNLRRNCDINILTQFRKKSVRVSDTPEQVYAVPEYVCSTKFNVYHLAASCRWYKQWRCHLLMALQFSVRYV